MDARHTEVVRCRAVVRVIAMMNEMSRIDEKIDEIKESSWRW